MTPYIPAFYIQGNEFPTKLKAGLYDKIYKKHGTQFYFESARGITLISSEIILVKYIDRFRQNKLRPCFQLTENAEANLWRRPVVNKKELQKRFSVPKNAMKKVDEYASSSAKLSAKSELPNSASLFSADTELSDEPASSSYEMDMYSSNDEDICITAPLRKSLENSLWDILDILFPNSNTLMHYGPMFVLGFLTILEAILHPAVDLLIYVLDKLREQEVILCVNGKSFELRNALNFVPFGNTLPPPYAQLASERSYPAPLTNAKKEDFINSNSEPIVSSGVPSSDPCTCGTLKNSGKKSYRSLWRNSQ